MIRSWRSTARLWIGPARQATSASREVLLPAAAEPEIVEGLVVPVRGADGPSLGTLWAVDAEDARVMEELAV